MDEDEVSDFLKYGRTFVSSRGSSHLIIFKLDEYSDNHTAGLTILQAKEVLYLLIKPCP
jgi:hypothetical protein